jgi:MFS family permease
VSASIPTAGTVEVAAVQRRTVGVLSAAQLLGGVAIAGSLPAGALAGAALGGEAAAGLAQTCGVLGAAVFALPLARHALSRGRRAALATGYGVGLAGAMVVIVAMAMANLPVFLFGFLLLGVATAAGYQARYAATDLALEVRRGRALALVVWAGTLGAVLGPNLLEASGNLARLFGLPALIGPFLIAATTLAAAVAVLLVLLRPDPYLLARSMSQAAASAPIPAPNLRHGWQLLRVRHRAVLGISAVAIGHVVMIMVMVMTPVHMAMVDVSLQLIGLVISVHVLGMFAFAPLVGWAVDRVGRIPVTAAGAGMLGAACVVSGLAPADDVAVLGLGLFLLGLGWSCTLVAGSTMLTDDIDQVDRPPVQGLSDLVMNAAAAVGGVVAGLIVVAGSYGTLCAVATIPVLVLVALLASPTMRRP